MQLLEPAGYIANIQSHILIGALIVAAVIGISLIAITFFVVFRYKDGKKKRTYKPDWSANEKMLLPLWMFACLFVAGISLIIWETAHATDPYAAIPSSVKPITIQVVALQWKWLFIYPKEKIATINFIEIPVNTPIQFQLTADAPMNSFWVPRLGGQMYAMAGMVTQLHLVANQIGSFPGGGAEMSGAGFSGMTFTVKSVTKQAYATWVAKVQKSPRQLQATTYAQLAKPSSYNPVTLYRYTDENLYNDIIMQFMGPMSPGSAPKSTAGPMQM